MLDVMTSSPVTYLSKTLFWSILMSFFQTCQRQLKFCL